jgi:carbon monoxide dehydrogenase subunit G
MSGCQICPAKDVARHYIFSRQEEGFSYMKLSGTHKFAQPSAQVFQALFNPAVLKPSIPGCNNVSFPDPNHMTIEITTSLPKLHGPFALTVAIPRAQNPNYLELQLVRQGRGGSINALAQINIADEANGALLSYTATAELEGLVAVANNPIGEGIVKNSLNTFFKNLEKSI